jgi:hypothetical protein
VTIRELELVGIVTAIAALWSELLHLLSWPRKLLVVSRRVDHDAGSAILGYLKATGRSRPRDGGYYGADRHHVRPMGRSMLVFYERLCRGAQLAWLGRVPIWFVFTESAPGNGGPADVHYTFYFLRGSLAWEALCQRTATWDDVQRQAHGGSRYRLHHHGARDQNDPPTAASTPTAIGQDGQRILHWRTEDLGYARPAGLDAMSLRPEVASLARDVARFISSREWYEERGIPWRRGWQLHGAPGTGKTTFVRSIALEHDLPVHTFDLGSMSNSHLRMAWDAMLRDTPCIALIEDIDGVYGVEQHDGTWDGRALRTQSGPTFDSLLQCVGGIATCDGVLLFVTTNHPKRIDPALRRGGRLDVTVEFLSPDLEGRRKIARRILGEGADVDAVLRAMPDASAADLQERLSELALAERFGDVA